MKLRDVKSLWNLWPPFLGLGISIKSISDDYKKTIVVLKKRFWNVNYFGTQYGGGIFAMTDGVHVLMLIHLLPREYKIWDKSASIYYLKRGLTNLTTECVITDEDIQFIQSELATKPSLDWTATIDIYDTQQQLIAQVTRTVSIKRKD